VFASPYRLVTSIRPNVTPGILVAASGASIVFTATPFLVIAVVEDFGVSLAAASSISTAQLAGFVVASWLGGRRLRPTRRLILGSVAFLVITNGLSAVAPSFTALLVLRALSGISLGLITWIAWAEAAGSSGRMRDVAVVGPLTGAIAAPFLGWAATSGGTELVYGLLAVIAAAPLFLPSEPSSELVSDRGPRRKAVPAARAVLVAMLLITAGGSAVFVYAAAIALEDTTLGSTAISLAFSANAVVSIPVARWRGTRRIAGVGYIAAGMCALLVGLAPSAALWFLGLTLWGACFWYATPATHQILAERSRYPQERVGDAQALMAAGRVLGPVIAGLAISAGSTTTLALVGMGLMVTSGVIVIAIEQLVPPIEPAE